VTGKEAADMFIADFNELGRGVVVVFNPSDEVCLVCECLHCLWHLLRVCVYVYERERERECVCYCVAMKSALSASASTVFGTCCVCVYMCMRERERLRV